MNITHIILRPEIRLDNSTEIKHYPYHASIYTTTFSIFFLWEKQILKTCVSRNSVIILFEF